MEEEMFVPGDTGKVKACFGIALVGFFLAFFYPLISGNNSFELVISGISESCMVSIIGLILMTGAFFRARREFNDDDNRSALKIMGLAMASCMVLCIVLGYAVNNPASKLAQIIIEMRTFALLGILTVVASFFFAMASGFKKLNEWSNLKGMKLAYYGSLTCGGIYLLVCMILFQLTAFKGINTTLVDFLKVLPYIGSVMVMSGLAMAFLSDCKVLEGEENDGARDAGSL